MTPPSAAARRSVSAFRHRNYRLFFVGQAVSLVGTWMTRVATGWLVYRLTGSIFLLGVTGFLLNIEIKPTPGTEQARASNCRFTRDSFQSGWAAST